MVVRAAGAGVVVTETLGAVAVCVTTGAGVVVTDALGTVTVRVITGAGVVVVRETVTVLVTTGADVLGRLVLDVDAVVVLRGPRLSATDSGSEDRPMRWLTRWLAAHVTPAVSASPTSAASAQSTVPRFTLVTLVAGRLSDRKAPVGRNRPHVSSRWCLNRNVATAPPAGPLSNVTSPPHSRASSRAIASPRPVPVGPARPARPRWKRSKTSSRSSPATPGPASWISSRSGHTAIVTVEPLGAYRSAFSTSASTARSASARAHHTAAAPRFSVARVLERDMPVIGGPAPTLAGVGGELVELEELAG